MSALEGVGVRVELPKGWEGRVEGRGPDASADAGAAGVDPAGEAPLTAIVHLANFPLPVTLGDFGGGAVDGMRSGDVFLVLFEYARESTGTALFQSLGLPRVRANDFHPNALRKMIDGQSGLQRFFQLDGRAFCVYVVLGSHIRRFGLTPVVNELIGSIQLG